MTEPSGCVAGAGRLLRGEAVLLFAFDVASEIDTRRVGEILSRTPTRLSLRTDRTAPKTVPIYRPLEIDVERPARSGGKPVGVRVRVYDVGVVTVTLRVPVEVRALAELLPLHALRLDDGRLADEVAAGVCADVSRELLPLMTRPIPPTGPEGYAVFCLTDLGGETDTARWLAGCDREVAGLLTETPADRLSDAQVAEVLRLRRSFARDDLVVVDWDAALVVELTGQVEDVLYVLEVANLQLVEFRVLDQFLDRYLDESYADLDRKHRPAWGRVPTVLRRLRRLRVELTQLADQVTHITKFIGDWYLARVYLAVSERFALDRWRASVESRLGQLDQIYSVVQSEAYEQRMLILEVTIVVLFVVDVIAILFWKV
ncbi:MAG: hypothetical protein JWO38_3375 [Gemmataceae bacterium]|nr:hypothetical protein [Gemmataceae bacterium]